MYYNKIWPRADGLDMACLKPTDRQKNIINDKGNPTTSQKSMGKEEEIAQPMVLWKICSIGKISRLELHQTPYT